ncbi:MAG: DRTGG domain-containing protein [Roseburia sp.]|nr:DRTGG domain-containing protein [Roseburia sp.]
MTEKEIAERLDADIVVSTGVSVDGFYAGDFISRVISKAPENSCWLTIMSNVNVAGAAVMGDIKIVVLCEGVEPDPALTQKCRANDIALMRTDLDTYNACKKL